MEPFTYISCDIPAGMTVTEYRRSRARQGSSRIGRKAALVGLALLLAGLAVAGPAAAAFDGRNGRIAFTSGRANTGDDQAQLYTLNPLRPFSVSEPFSIPGFQNRHASFSPDRTKVVFAAGTPGSPTTENFDLFVRDFVTGNIAPLDAAETNSSDHPAWSPDGTRIAYEHQPTPGSAERNIKVKTFGSAVGAVNLTTGAPVELKPAWSPDSQTLYYAKLSPTPALNYNIVKQPASGGGETGVLTDPGVDEYQPAISADGSKICYTRQAVLQNSPSANIMVANLADLDSPQTHSPDAAKGDINCAFSPDGKKIVYTNGTFSQGRLVTKNVGDLGEPTPLTDDDGSNNFDGNADWIPDGSPDCPDKTVATQANTALTIELECTDTGPAWERTDPNGFVDTKPQNGTTSDDNPTGNPSTVRYTPNPGFSGTDQIAYSAFDDFGFATDKGTITINVAPAATGGGAVGGGAAKPKCAGLTATIVGSSRSETLRGTPRRDVIVAGAGNDVVRAGSGNDLVCGGSGNDRLGGGSGNDRLGGGGGNDRLAGDAGRDLLSGAAGRDRLNGGRGSDTCIGGRGRDRASCERKRSI